MKSSALRLWPLLVPISFWALALIVFHYSSEPLDVLPPIASGGLNDVWFFYLPLMIFTLATLFFFTRKRELPDWKTYAVSRRTVKRDLLLALGYLISVQLILATLFDVGLHFPGPRVYQADAFGVADLAVWALLQSLFFVLIPYLWLRSQGFSLRALWRGIDFRRDGWIMLFYWCGDFFGVVAITNFLQVPAQDYVYAIPVGIFFNLLGAGLPVLVMIHLIIIPRLSHLFDNQLLVIVLGGVAYALFSLFDPGVNYSTATAGVVTLSYIFMTQTLIGMGKAAFTVRTGNPFIHLTSYHIFGARVAFDTAMYAEIFRR